MQFTLTSLLALCVFTITSLALFGPMGGAVVVGYSWFFVWMAERGHYTFRQLVMMLLVMVAVVGVVFSQPCGQAPSTPLQQDFWKEPSAAPRSAFERDLAAMSRSAEVLVVLALVWLGSLMAFIATVFRCRRARLAADARDGETPPSCDTHTGETPVARDIISPISPLDREKDHDQT